MFRQLSSLAFTFAALLRWKIARLSLAMPGGRPCVTGLRLPIGQAHICACYVLVGGHMLDMEEDYYKDVSGLVIGGVGVDHLGKCYRSFPRSHD